VNDKPDLGAVSTKETDLNFERVNIKHRRKKLISKKWKNNNTNYNGLNTLLLLSINTQQLTRRSGGISEK